MDDDPSPTARPSRILDRAKAGDDTVVCKRRCLELQALYRDISNSKMSHHITLKAELETPKIEVPPPASVPVPIAPDDQAVPPPPPAQRPVPEPTPPRPAETLPSLVINQPSAASIDDPPQDAPAAPTTCASDEPSSEPIPVQPPQQHLPKGSGLNLEPETQPHLAPPPSWEDTPKNIDDRRAPWDWHSTHEILTSILRAVNPQQERASPHLQQLQHLQHLQQDCPDGHVSHQPPSSVQPLVCPLPLALRPAADKAGRESHTPGPMPGSLPPPSEETPGGGDEHEQDTWPPQGGSEPPHADAESALSHMKGWYVWWLREHRRRRACRPEQG
ncbi:uncharacterized protein LY79DRAFT_573957 [Colletotrichum navitas]|uniref:Uncharacterized protein n=1 Tax=Colletotrichum navitas TaxID=681940 RepID=A0AAD8PIM2_9PEZI|nr:uncharacterized protein LY79DRAFT_573957 [Colletotrichum navitas]KAK1561704.1 hypothetical protein LY79DRAFT_573957 [Colletotrichum navitas]